MGTSKGEDRVTPSTSPIGGPARLARAGSFTAKNIVKKTFNRLGASTATSSTSVVSSRELASIDNMPIMTSAPSAAILPSSNPGEDARIMKHLFPNRYNLEGGSSTGVSVATQAVLVGESDVVFFFLQKDVVAAAPQTEGTAIAPNTTMSVNREELLHVVAFIREQQQPQQQQQEQSQESASMLRLLAVLTGNEDGVAVTFIQLAGGSVIALLLKQGLDTPEARNNLSKVLSGTKDDEADGSFVTEGNVSDPSSSQSRTVAAPVLQPAGIPPPPRFPRLEIGVADDKCQQDFVVNSRVPIPVETDLFVGQMLLILRPGGEKKELWKEKDPFYYERIFEKKKRRMELQLQGRLKYNPKGTLYCGGEISEKMKLGLVSKGLCNLLLKLIGNLTTGLHYSFGTSSEDEYPHVVFPAYTFFDRLVATKPGETPPVLGEILPESSKDAAERQASGKLGEWNTEDIYSMSFNSMYIDLPTWQLVSLPMMRDMNLHTFWGDSFLRISLYESNAAEEAKHLKVDNKYIVSLKVKYLPNAKVTMEADEVEQEDSGSLPWNKVRPKVARSARSMANLVAMDDDVESPETVEKTDSGDDSAGDSSDDDKYFDAAELLSSRTDDSTITPPSSAATSPNRRLIESVEEETPTSFDPKLMMAQAGNLPSDMFCPAWVDACDEKGKYTRLFAFTVLDKTRTVLRTSSEFAKSFALNDAWTHTGVSERAAYAERVRRSMGLALAEVQHSSQSRKIESFLMFINDKSEFDTNFLQRPKPPKSFACSTSNLVTGEVLMSGFAARAMSDRHWVEEWVVLTEKHISFFAPDSKKATHRVFVSAVLSTRTLMPEEGPNMPTFHILSFETLGRTDYLMFQSEAHRSKWHDALSSVAAKNTPKKKSGGVRWSGLDMLMSDDPAEEYMHKSSGWDCKRRRILNCRQFNFTSLGRVAGGEKLGDPNHPCEVVKDVLRKVLHPDIEGNPTKLQDFLNAAAALKKVNVAALNEEERTAFFINLYHIMVMHGYIVLGIPNSSFKWLSYFNMIAYQCSDDIFTLTELEHCIVRAKLSAPANFVAKFALPKSKYSFALQRADYRINFALNCGSISNPESVVVFDPVFLDRQLDETIKLHLEEAMEVKTDKEGKSLYVTLPKVCQWYAADFGKGRSLDAVLAVMKHLNSRRQEALSSFIDVKRSFPKTDGELYVSFAPFSFTCRHLKVRD